MARPDPGPRARRQVTDVQIPIAGDAGHLPGMLDQSGPRGLAIFAHGSGSSRLSPRNRQVARALRQAGISTLLFDLLTGPEAADRANVFDIPLLAQRVVDAIDWARSRTDMQALPLGLFGASTGAAAALVAAAERPAEVAAVVSRGGRADMASGRLAEVRCPTLLIVGGADTQVLEFNRRALGELTCQKALHIVPGATHLFEEPGALDAVVAAAIRWFHDSFAAAAPPS